MTTEITQVHQDGDVKTEIVSANVPASEPVIIQDLPETETAEDAWRSFRNKTTVLFANAIETTREFLKNNQSFLINAGWVLLALIGLQLLLAILDIIDNLPLVSPLLKLVGLLYVGWFTWRYLLRASNRQELAQMIARAKAEFFGDQV